MKNKKTLVLGFALVLLVLITGVAFAETKFYIIGAYIDNETEKPCYWINGVERKPAGSSGLIAVDGNTVYTADSTSYRVNYDNRDKKAHYWIGERKIDLPFPPPIEITGIGRMDNNYISKIAANGGKFYLTGNYSEPRGWLGYCIVNGVWKAFKGDFIDDVFVDDGVIYMIGGTYGGNMRPYKWCYAYGQKYSHDQYAAYTAIAAEHGKVYVSGHTDSNSNNSNSSPFYLIDGIRKPLSDPTPSLDTRTNGIAVEDGNVAVLGYSVNKDANRSIAKSYYWINEERKELPDAASVTGIAMIDGKVYITGSFKQGPIERGCYWIDGVRKDLPGNARRANGITVTR